MKVIFGVGVWDDVDVIGMGVVLCECCVCVCDVCVEVWICCVK